MTVPTLGMATGSESILSAELGAAAAAAATELGVNVRRVATVADARGVDVVLGIGYPVHYPALNDETVEGSRVAWLGEPLPPLDEPLADRVLRLVPMGRVLDASIAVAAFANRGRRPARLGRWREAAAYAYDRRYNVREHSRAFATGIKLVVTSADQAASLARRGIPARVLPFGYHRSIAGDPVSPSTGDRDIDLLVLGTATTGVPTRRARITRDTLAGLDAAVRVVVVEDGLWGATRTAMLRRARIVLNVHRVPGNYTGIRTMLAAAAGALIVSEPVAAPSPFVAGTHYVEADEANLATAVHEHLASQPRRVALAEACQALVLEQITMRASMERLLGSPQ
ncbi:MAG TPA: glycosyltransferase [Candidatus Limnocylindrales bacterium]